MTKSANPPLDPTCAATYVVCRSLLLSGLDPAGPAETLIAGVEEHVLAHFKDADRESLTDLNNRTATVLKAISAGDGADGWENAYRLLLDHVALDVDWDGDMPVIPTSKIRTWLGLLNDFDENVLLCLDLVLRRRPTGQPPLLPEKWGLVTRVGDFDLDRLLARMATDLHVHLGGMRQPALAWARAMASGDGWRAFDVLPKRFKELDLDWGEIAEQAYKDRLALCGILADRDVKLTGRPRDAIDSFAISTRDAWRNPDPLHIVTIERRLLIGALWALRLTAPSHDAQDRKVAKALSEHLWRYIRAKHFFQRCARQPAFADSPGLRRFDNGFFRAVKHRDSARYAPRETAPLSEFRANHAFARAEQWAAAHVLASEDCLQRVELRISPLPRVVDYFMFLKSWKHIVDDFAKRGCRLPEVHFAVHFVRTSRADQRRTRALATPPVIPAAERWAEFHADIGRKAAVLHRALTDPDHLDLTSMIRRIDVAGQERDTPIELFAPHLRLLRGDEFALQALEDLEAVGTSTTQKATEPVHDVYRHAREWRDMARTGRHRLRRGRQLALTVHAGEDYADPLEGLFQIWAAVELCGMKSGEAIGHALALAAQLKNKAGWHSTFSTITPLQNWASLAWLRWVLRQRDDLTRLASKEGQQLELLIREANPIEADTTVNHSDRRFEACYLGRHTGETGDRSGASRKGTASLTEFLWSSMEQSGDAVALAGRAKLRPLVKEAQNWLLDLLIAKRIVVEANPSSNLRVSGAQSLAELGTVRLLEKVDKGLLLCINTDNPGTFSASIRNEYALLLQGALDSNPKDKAGVRRKLAEVLETGHSGIRFR